MNKRTAIAALLFLQVAFVAGGAELAALCTDRAAIERVYHAHRLGTKQTFEQVMPREMIEKLVRQDQHKEAVLGKNYGVEITPAMTAAEVQRIHTTTRAPGMLAEIKAALGNDATRFAAAMARPIVVERTLRAHFENDDKLHAPQRREAGKARADLLARKTVEGSRDVTWQLAPRPAAENSALSTQHSAIATAPAKTTAASGSYSIEATTPLAQTLTPLAPDASERGKLYFDDLAPELQNVLRAQLREAGDVSAVIETPAAFVVFVAKEKNAATLTASSLTIPKRSYDEWLAQQPQDTK